MKLSDVTVANGLVKKRRELTEAYVSIGRERERLSETTLFGYRVNDRMAEAVRKAMRDEVRSWIAELDEELVGLGVEVDGIEVTIAREESMEQPKAVREEAA